MNGIEDILKFNPNHEPGGSSKGGEFAHGKGMAGLGIANGEPGGGKALHIEGRHGRSGGGSGDIGWGNGDSVRIPLGGKPNTMRTDEARLEVNHASGGYRWSVWRVPVIEDAISGRKDVRNHEAKLLDQGVATTREEARSDAEAHFYNHYPNHGVTVDPVTGLERHPKYGLMPPTVKPAKGVWLEPAPSKSPSQAISEAKQRMANSGSDPSWINQKLGM